MKLIDKYLLRTFMVPLIYCLAAFFLIYIVYDLFDNLSDFIQAGTNLLAVAQFYIMLLPSVVIYIVPISLLLAVLYSLSQLTKNNELTAMRASGVSLYRLMLPFVLVGVFTSIAVAAINETVAPWSAYWTYQFLNYEKHKEEYSIYEAMHLAYKNEDAHRVWLINKFHKKTYDMTAVEVVEQREDGSDKAKIQAARGEWLDGRWWFYDLAIQKYDQNGHPMGAPDLRRRAEMTDYTETPDNFLNEIKDPQYLSSLELLTFIETHKRLSEDTIARVRVDFYHRLAMPWTCLIVTLIGIPFGAQTGRKGAFLGVALCLGLFFSYYTLINLGLAFGKKQAMTPWFSAWLPNILFLGIALVMVWRMR